MIRKIVNGMKIFTGDKELENISDVGPGGQYISEEHTMEYMYSELYITRLFNKMGYPSWVREGKKDVARLAGEKIEERLESFEYQDITKEQESVLREYIGDLYDTI
ncbi:trimethylamine methyltransferase family protein [Blautia liquoris]|uniref:Trimethylamine methyltransferase family protein n=1 Tax=Blautia liquoris TaxID=2779518 RepID=A0A7M2RNB9_9FIRM|nr:trimethylamine methyltransferase family protein [Blautia liquoris]